MIIGGAAPEGIITLDDEILILANLPSIRVKVIGDVGAVTWASRTSHVWNLPADSGKVIEFSLALYTHRSNVGAPIDPSADWS